METPNMEPCPWGAFGQYPNVMISGLGGFTPIAEEFFDAKQPMESPYTGSLDFTVGVQNASYTTPQFGNAIQFSAKLIVGHLDKLPNLNLDGDRGYGFKTWRLKGLDPNADPGATPMIEQMPLQPEYGPTV